MKKLAISMIGVLFVGALCVSLAACGGSSGGSSETTGSGTEEGGEPSGAITIWDFEYESEIPYTEAVNQIDKEFEKKYPAVTVKRVAQPIETANQLYQAAFVANEGPDLMIMFPGAAGTLHFKQGLEPLNQYISDELNSQLEQWESVTPGYSAEGERFALPLGFNGNLFYYNKKLFEKAGLPSDFEPTSWDEVLEAGEKLKAAGIQPFAGGNKGGTENLFWLSMGLESMNSVQEAVELGEGKISWTDPRVKAAFEPEFQMQEAGFYPAHRFSTEIGEGWAEFAEGKGAMTLGFWNSVGYWGEFNEALEEKNVGMFFAPGGSYVGTTGNITIAMPKFAENKDAAAAFLKFEGSKKAIEVLSRVGGFMPNRKDVPIPADAPVQEQELLEASRAPNRGPQPPQMVPGPLIFGGALANEINEALQGRKTLDEALQGIQEASEVTPG